MPITYSLKQLLQERTLRLIIAGSREFSDYLFLCQQVDAFQQQYGKITQVICGMARGADMLGRRYARARYIPVREMPADWKHYGKSAGYRRNQDMAKVADAAIVFRVNQSRGSGHMIDIAKAQGLLTITIDLDQTQKPLTIVFDL